MKKIYMNPELEVVKISTSVQMLAGSLTVDGGDSGSGTVSEDDAPEGEEGGARGGSFFGD